MPCLVYDKLQHTASPIGNFIKDSGLAFTVLAHIANRKIETWRKKEEADRKEDKMIEVQECRALGPENEFLSWVRLIAACRVLLFEARSSVKIYSGGTGEETAYSFHIDSLIQDWDNVQLHIDNAASLQERSSSQLYSQNWQIRSIVRGQLTAV